MKQQYFPHRQSGGTFLGFVVGVVVGLALAAAVALFVTKAPIPFMNKGGPHTADMSPSTAGAPPPDPNKPLYGKDPRASNPAVVPVPGAPVDAGAAPQETKKFSFYDLIPSRSQGAAPAAPPGASASANPSPASAAPADAQQYALQAGAFKNQSEADAMRARLALLGFDAKVSTIDRNGDTLYRVRLGPLGRLEDANRARQTLAQNGIDASVIKAQP